MGFFSLLPNVAFLYDWGLQFMATMVVMAHLLRILDIDDPKICQKLTFLG